TRSIIHKCCDDYVHRVRGLSCRPRQRGAGSDQRLRLFLGAVVEDQPETGTLDIVRNSSPQAPKSDARDGNVCLSHKFLSSSYSFDLRTSTMVLSKAVSELKSRST